MFLESWEVEPLYREPYVLKGYRRPGSSVWEALKSTVHLHNDVVNFWSHFIPCLIWSFLFLGSLMQPWTSHALYQPLLCLHLSMCLMSLCSSFAHAFSFAGSSKFFRLVFMVDYVGITVFGLAWNLCYLYYKVPGSTVAGVSKEIWVILFVAVSVYCTVVSCVSKLYFLHPNSGTVKIARAFIFGPPVLLNVFIHVAGVFTSGVDSQPSESLANLLYVLVYGLMLVSMVFYGSKFPERFWPGKFDYFGHSHQYFHIFGALATHLLYIALKYNSEQVFVTLCQHKPGAGCNVLDDQILQLSGPAGKATNGRFMGMEHTWYAFSTAVAINFSVVFTVSQFGLHCSKTAKHQKKDEQYDESFFPGTRFCGKHAHCGKQQCFNSSSQLPLIATSSQYCAQNDYFPHGAGQEESAVSFGDLSTLQEEANVAINSHMRQVEPNDSGVSIAAISRRDRHRSFQGSSSEVARTSSESHLVRRSSGPAGARDSRGATVCIDIC